MMSVPTKFYQPSTKNGKLIEVCEPDSKKGAKRNESTLMNKGAVDRMPIESAFRELLTNLIDAAVEANGHSFLGIKITTVTKETSAGEKSVTSFHTDLHVLAEIIQSEKKLEFVNYGSKVETFEQVIQIGASRKKNQKNQAGQHGEGLKRAALKLVSEDYNVELNFAISTWQDSAEFRRLTFKLGSDDCLAFGFCPINPSERHKGKKDFHRFEVVLTNSDGIPDFYLSDHMVPDEFLRGARDADDAGMVLLDPKNKGEVYIWHFYINGYKRLLFGYDLFIPTITRDRDNINVDVLIQHIAIVWSRTIIEDDAMAQLFFDRVLMDPDMDLKMFEVCALSSLSIPAAEKIYRLFVAKHGDGCRPIRDKDMKDMFPQFQKSRFVIASWAMMEVLDLVCGKTEAFLSDGISRFNASPSRLLDEKFGIILQESIGEVYIVDDALSFVKYSYNRETKILLLNARDMFSEDGTLIDKSKFWSFVVFRVLADIFHNDESFDGMVIMKKLLAQSEAPVEILTDDEDQHNDVQDECNGENNDVQDECNGEHNDVQDECNGENNGEHNGENKRYRQCDTPDVRKRLREESLEANVSNPLQPEPHQYLPEPPAGFMYYNGPPLLVPIGLN